MILTQEDQTDNTDNTEDQKSEPQQEDNIKRRKIMIATKAADQMIAEIVTKMAENQKEESDEDM